MTYNVFGGTLNLAQLVNQCTVAVRFDTLQVTSHDSGVDITFRVNQKVSIN